MGLPNFQIPKFLCPKSNYIELCFYSKFKTNEYIDSHK